MEEFKARRAKLLEQLPDNSAVLLSGGKLKSRNGDAEYLFRQDSDFYYLTGFKEPNCFLALVKNSKKDQKFILFCQERNPDAEVWTGKRLGQSGAVSVLGADLSFPIDKVAEEMPKALGNTKVIYCPAELDLKSFNDIPSKHEDIQPILHEMRLFKDETEINNMRKAAKISAQGHQKLMQECKPGMQEYQLEAKFVEHCMYEGCRAMAYTSIVAGGENGCTLHYVDNSSVLQDGDLVLIDAGGEYDYYAADITRTFPINGKFTKEQRAIYELVLTAQEVGIAQVMPGAKWNLVQESIVEILVAGLVDLGLLSGDIDELIAQDAYRQFYMHSSGHWLGLCVDPIRLV